MSSNELGAGKSGNFSNLAAGIRKNEIQDFQDIYELKDIQPSINSDAKIHEQIEIEEPEEIVPLIVEKNSNENGITRIIVSNCRVKSEIFEILESSTASKEVMLINLKFINHLPELEINDLDDMAIKCKNKSVVVVLESKDVQNFSIYWKFKELEHFWALKIDENLKMEENISVKEFVAEFLLESLKNQHAGLLSKFNKHQVKKSVELDFLADHRDYNLLLLATEQGNAELVKILIKLNLITKSLNNSIDARDVAMQNKHLEIIMIFLEANMPFPNTFEASKTTGKLKEFCDITQELHQHVVDNNVKKVEEILDQFKDLKIFYNFKNHSAVRVALQNRSLDVYELLLSRKSSFAPNEVAKNYLQSMKHNDSRKIREIHNTYSDHLADKHINILMSNSHVFQEKSDGKDKRQIIRGAFEALNSNPFIQIILKIVAASMNFKLIFDFNRDTVDIVDPTADEYTEGLFYLSGRIYIGAKQLLNKATEHEAIGVIAHELCHYAMNLVFKNDARPYRSNNKVVKQEFEDVSQECQEKQEEEVLISLVYDYQPDMHHAELIVRVVHLMALYSKLPEKLKEIRSIFSRLFEFYETKVVPELEKALPKIEKKQRQKDQKIWKLKRYLVIATILSVLFIVGGIYVTFYIFWTCQYDKLSVSQKTSIKNGTLLYKNHKVQFQQLFPLKSAAYGALKSEHCSAFLDGKSLNFDSQNFHYLYDQVSISSKVIQDAISNASIIYGNMTVQFHELFADDSLAYKMLNSANLSEILKENPLDFVDLSYLYGYTSVDSEIIRKSLSDAAVQYKNVNVKFSDLFKENSTIYANLTSDTVSKMLYGEPLDFSNEHMFYLDKQVKHSWGNLSQKLKNKFLHSNVIFQNEVLKFRDMEVLSAKSFDSLTNAQILAVLNGQTIKVHEMISNETNFYVERKFRNENYFEIYFIFMNDIAVNLNGGCEYTNSSESTKTFEDYYSEFIRQNASVEIQKVNEIRKDVFFDICHLSLTFEIKDEESQNITDTSLNHDLCKGSDFNEIFMEVVKSKVFILSAEAGAGKTVSFEQFALKLKKKYPTHWISYIDLKDHKKLYNSSRKLEDIQGLLEGILGLNSGNEFERQTFWELFESGNVILLWNGFDEISPMFSDFIMNVLSSISQKSNNIQFVCTRPLYSNDLKLLFNYMTFTLVPFNHQEQNEFLMKFFISKNIEDKKIPEYIQKVLKIKDSTSLIKNFDTPLLLIMIADLISSDVKIYESENLYEIYEKFVKKKIEIWQQKSDFARNFLADALTEYRKFDMLELYQKYAIETELANTKYYRNANKLTIMSQNFPPELTSDEISRMGILYINGPENIKFAHKTFAEFFITQFFVDNIYFERALESDEEAEQRLDLFDKIVTSESGGYIVKIVQNFLKNFLETKRSQKIQKFHRKIQDAFRNKHKRIFFKFISRTIKAAFFKLLLNFLKKDQNLLKELLHVDEDETLYTAALNYKYFYDHSVVDYIVIRNLTRPLLTDDEYQKFIHGKNQKGVILFSTYCFSKYKKRNISNDEYPLDEELLKNDNDVEVFESIAKNLTKDELDELLMKETSPLYQGGHIEFYSRKDFWDFVERNLTNDEQKRLIMNVVKSWMISYDYESDGQELLKKILRLDDIMSDSEIFDFFLKKNIFTEFSYLKHNLVSTLWNFLANHTNIEQQKIILAKKDGDSLTLLHNVLIRYYTQNEYEKFKIIPDIYEAVYTDKSEYQKVFLSAENFFFQLFDVDPYTCGDQFNFVKNLFLGNNDSLKTMLERKNQNNLNVFDNFYNIRDSIDCYKPFHELFLSLSK